MKLFALHRSRPGSRTPFRGEFRCLRTLLPLLAAQLLATQLLGGCALAGAGISLEVATPELPVWWRPRTERMRYELRWIDPVGSLRSADASPGERVRVELPRLANSPVLITPVYETGRGVRRLLPGAALFPQDLRDQGALQGSWLQGSWHRGFEGALFLELQRRGYAYFQVNQPRLETGLSERCGEDPWSADLERVLRALLAGSFRSSYLSPRESAAGMRELPAGSYVRENVLLPPVETVEIDGRTFLVLEELYPGHHRFFHADGNGELLVSNDGEHEMEWTFFSGE